MSRAPIVVTATAVGTAAVLAFHPHQSAPAAHPHATSAAPSQGTQTATGDAVDTRYGPAQVRVTISGGRITDVQALQLQANDPRSAQISAYAEPYLRQSALAKQSAAIDAVSGATYTSESYAASLQSALDKLGRR